MHHDDDDDDDVFRKKHSHLVFLYNSLKYQLIAVKTSHNSVEGMMNRICLKKICLLNIFLSGM